jgi:hypothetical protein
MDFEPELNSYFSPVVPPEFSPSSASFRDYEQSMPPSDGRYLPPGSWDDFQFSTPSSGIQSAPTRPNLSQMRSVSYQGQQPTAVRRSQASTSQIPQMEAPSAATNPSGGVSDFVKKLFLIVGEPSTDEIICWGPNGDTFIIRDPNEFTKAILPRVFKHSNFARFVRQLNKYDFHKARFRYQK